jgi:hypothetical protein
MLVGVDSSSELAYLVLVTQAPLMVRRCTQRRLSTRDRLGQEKLPCQALSRALGIRFRRRCWYYQLSSNQRHFSKALLSTSEHPAPISLSLTAYLLISRHFAPFLQNHTVTTQKTVAMAARIDPLMLLPSPMNICSPNMGKTALRIPLRNASGAFAEAA